MIDPGYLILTVPSRIKARGWAGLGLVLVLTASILTAPLPASAAEPPLPPGASRFHPVAAQGSAAGRGRAVAPAETAAAASSPPAPPVLPPGATGVAGPQRRYPDPGKSRTQCSPCPPGTTPTLPASGREGDHVDRGKVTMTHGAPPKGFVAGASRELVETRTATSTTFANPDGTKTARIHSGPVYALTASGQMVPIDRRLERRFGDRYRPVAAANVSFALTATDPTVASLVLGNGVEAGFGVAGAADVPVVVNGPEARYVGVRDHADLVLESTSAGISERIVLGSARAPTTWRFSLRLRGLVPELGGGGRVDLRDAGGAIRAVIPPGHMVDSGADPRTGAGVRSDGVSYALSREGDTWVLELSLDETWLRSPARRFPVTVDPPLALRSTATEDTYVSSRDSAGRDNSFETFLRVGTYNGGGDKSAAYLRFIGLETLFDRYVVGASLNVYQSFAPSCTPSTLYVYRVTTSWFGSTATTWPGPAYDSANLVAQKAFANGGNCTTRPARYESIELNDWDRVTRWLDGSEPWYGFTLRASNTDNNGEKIFNSNSHPGGGAPFIDLNYYDEGAAYSLPTAAFEPPVTPSTYGFLDVNVKNLGRTTWYGLQAANDLA